ncbi:MAG: TerB family tellurite resistance protein [Rickettsiales bacterium]
MTNALVQRYAAWRGRVENISASLFHCAQKCNASVSRSFNMRAAKEAAARESENEDFRQMAFTFAVIALAAKLSQVDGSTSREEFVAFREVFPMPASEHGKIRKLFDMAAHDGAEVEQYARQVARLFPRAELLQDVLLRLFKVAVADGVLSTGEEVLLRRMARAFGISRVEFARMLRRHRKGLEEGNPHKVLGVKQGASADVIKRAYRRAMRECHPDHVMAQGGDADAMLVAQRRLAALNTAYATLRDAPKSSGILRI